jgi:endonuclease YncB( thermonuclease family)
MRPVHGVTPAPRPCASLPGRLLGLAALVLMAAWADAAVQLPAIVGPASVLDGDSLKVGDRQIRLFGIDAPERRQTCLDPAGQRYRCGDAARAALAGKIAGATIRCQPRSIDRYERWVAVCYRADEDLNGWLVAQGWALAYRHYSNDYVAAEDAARARRAGIWRGSFETPWDYRRQQRAARQARPRDPGCSIKGNINSRGERIYHLPGQRHYAQTHIDEAAGERYFCSEADARAAGWRRARQ